MKIVTQLLTGKTDGYFFFHRANIVFGYVIEGAKGELQKGCVVNDNSFYIFLSVFTPQVPGIKAYHVSRSLLSQDQEESC